MGHWRQANTGVQRFQRIASAVPVRISTVDPETDPVTGKSFFRAIEETTANLSQGGAYLRSWEPLRAGRRVVVSIDLPSSEELQLSARVVWARLELRPSSSANELEQSGYGVEFYGITRFELDCLGRLIHSLQSQSEAARPTHSAAPISQA